MKDYGFIFRTDKDFKKKAKKISELPKESQSMNYIIAKENYYFVYPNEQHYYEEQFKDSLCHGGISLQEMILPFIKLVPKGQ